MSGQGQYTAMTDQKHGHDQDHHHDEDGDKNKKMLKYVLIGVCCVICVIVFFCCILPLFALGAAATVAADELGKINWTEFNQSWQNVSQETNTTTSTETTSTETTNATVALTFLSFFLE